MARRSSIGEEQIARAMVASTSLREAARKVAISNSWFAKLAKRFAWFTEERTKMEARAKEKRLEPVREKKLALESDIRSAERKEIGARAALSRQLPKLYANEITKAEAKISDLVTGTRKLRAKHRAIEKRLAQ